MCGRYSLAYTKTRLEDQLSLDLPFDWEPRYNIAPTQEAVVVPEPGRAELMKWGLLPFWSKEGKVTGRMINARSETVASKPAFRAAVRKRRCLVPADSFYEWRKEGPQKQPYRIQLPDSNPLFFAGIYEHWQGNGQRIDTFSILTCPPNREMALLHDRMPVIIPHAEAREAWLCESSLEKALQWARPLADESLTYYPVSTQVNSPRNDCKALHTPKE